MEGVLWSLHFGLFRYNVNANANADSIIAAQIVAFSISPLILHSTIIGPNYGFKSCDCRFMRSPQPDWCQHLVKYIDGVNETNRPRSGAHDNRSHPCTIVFKEVHAFKEVALCHARC